MRPQPRRRSGHRECCSPTRVPGRGARDARAGPRRAGSGGRRGRRGAALEGLAFVTWKQSDLDASLAYSREHLKAAEARDDAAGISMAVEQMGLAYWHQGEHELARASFEHALEIAAAAENARGVIHACNDLAGLHWERDEFPEALERVREGLRAAEEIGYRHAAGVLIGNAAEIFRLRGRARARRSPRALRPRGRRRGRRSCRRDEECRKRGPYSRRDGA